MSENRHMWVARNKPYGDCDASYTLSANKPVLGVRSWNDNNGPDFNPTGLGSTIDCCAPVWEAATGLKLEPGGSPIKIRISIEKLKEEEKWYKRGTRIQLIGNIYLLCTIGKDFRLVNIESGTFWNTDPIRSHTYGSITLQDLSAHIGDEIWKEV